MQHEELKEKLTINVPLGNLLEGAATITVLIMVFMIDSDLMLHII
jgi:hypothetical protein